MTHIKEKRKGVSNTTGLPDPTDPDSQERLSLQPIGQDLTRKRYWVADGELTWLILSYLFVAPQLPVRHQVRKLPPPNRNFPHVRLSLLTHPLPCFPSRFFPRIYIDKPMEDVCELSDNRLDKRGIRRDHRKFEEDCTCGTQIRP